VGTKPKNGKEQAVERTRRGITKVSKKITMATYHGKDGLNTLEKKKNVNIEKEKGVSCIKGGNC